MPKTPQRAEFWVCDHCGKPIIPEANQDRSGFVVVGNIMVVNSKGEFDGGIIRDNFPQTKAFSVDDVGQCIFHTHCLIRILERDSIAEEAEETEDQDEEAYIIKRTHRKTLLCDYWNGGLDKWVGDKLQAESFYKSDAMGLVRGLSSDPMYRVAVIRC